MKPRLLLVVGLQKSGTTLLARLLQQHGFRNPFRGEGNAFWGNEPPFSPTGEPVGRIYQESGGEAGHEIGADRADRATADLLRARLREAAPEGGLLLNKNPYNSVRIPWLRALFPDAVIVSTWRRPLANVYSLTKKFVPHAQSGLGPEPSGWWGVKPRGWRALLDADKAVQCGRQWAAVNRRIREDRAGLDEWIAYHDLCARPGEIVARLLDRCAGGGPRPPLPIEPLRCFDDEVERGARLRSKNRYFAERGDLKIPEDEPLELEAFDDATAARVRAVCAGTEALLTGSS